MMAIALADFAFRCGVRTEIWPSSFSPEGAGTAHPVHFRWDASAVENRDVLGRVAGGDFPAPLPNWIVWLSHVPEAFEQLRTKTKNVLVPSFELEMASVRDALLYDLLACPSDCLYSELRYLETAVPVRCVPWTADLPAYDRRAFSGEHRLLLHLDERSAEWLGDRVLDTAAKLLSSCESAHITVSAVGGFSAYAVGALKKLTLEHPRRFFVLPRLSYTELLDAAAESDWIWLPLAASSSALVMAIALSTGRPVLAFDHPVPAELVRDGHNGVLTPAKLRSRGIFGMPVVSGFSASATAEVIKVTIESDAIQWRIGQECAPLHWRHISWQAVWEDISSFIGGGARHRNARDSYE